MESIYIGTSTNGIHNMNFLNGTFEKVRSNTNFKNCSYLCQNDNYIYHVVESSSNKEYPYGCIGALNKEDLSVINYKLPYGKGPCYLHLDKYRNIIYVSNYGKGSMSIYLLSDDGSIKKVLANIQYGSSSRIHCTALSNDGNFLFVSDLGNNRILAYKIDFLNEELMLNKVDEFIFPKFCQPRHIVINKVNDIIYVVTEFSCEIYSFILENSKLKYLDAISILPNKLKKQDNFTGCTIKISSDHKFMYTPVRGHDSISVFEINELKLDLIQNISCYGNNTRDINFNKDETFLLAANLNSSNISIFKRNKESGLLEFNDTYDIRNPACII